MRENKYRGVFYGVVFAVGLFPFLIIANLIGKIYFIMNDVSKWSTKMSLVGPLFLGAVFAFLVFLVPFLIIKNDFEKRRKSGGGPSKSSQKGVSS